MLDIDIWLWPRCEMHDFLDQECMGHRAGLPPTAKASICKPTARKSVPPMYVGGLTRENTPSSKCRDVKTETPEKAVIPRPTATQFIKQEHTLDNTLHPRPTQSPSMLASPSCLPRPPMRPSMSPTMSPTCMTPDAKQPVRCSSPCRDGGDWTCRMHWSPNKLDYQQVSVVCWHYVLRCI